MSFTINEIRQLIRATLSEGRSDSEKTGKVKIVGTKGLYMGTLTLECQIYIRNSEFRRLQQDLVDRGRLLSLATPPEADPVKFEDFEKFEKAIKANKQLRNFLRRWSPHHSPYAYGIFPTMTAPQYYDFVTMWRSNGFSEEGTWPDGTLFHNDYNKERECRYCEARFSKIRGIGDPLVAQLEAQIHKDSKSRILSTTDRGTPGFCCGDPVRPRILYWDEMNQAAYRAGESGKRPKRLCTHCNRLERPIKDDLCPVCFTALDIGGEEIFYEKGPGPKTLEWLQYENEAVALAVYHIYQDDVLETIKNRINVPPKGLMDELTEHIRSNPDDKKTIKQKKALKNMGSKIFGKIDKSTGWPKNVEYKIPKRRFSKQRNVAPPDLNSYLYEPQSGVDVETGSDPWRVYNIEVDLILESEAHHDEKLSEVVESGDNIPDDDFAAKKAYLQRLARWDKKEAEGQTGFFNILKKLVDHHLDKKHIYSYSENYVSPDGRSYPVSYIKTGMASLNWIIDPFMPHKKEEIKKLVSRGQLSPGTSFDSIPHKEDEKWSNFGRNDSALYDDLKEWFGLMFDMTLAPWQQESPFPIDSEGNIYFLTDDNILMLDVKGTVDWHGILKNITGEDLEDEDDWGGEEADSYFKRLKSLRNAKKSEGKHTPEWIRNYESRKPTYPQLRGRITARNPDGNGLKLHVIKNGCEVMKALGSIARSLIKSPPEGYSNRTLNDKRDLIRAFLNTTPLMPSFAPELDRLAKQCVNNEDYTDELIESLKFPERGSAKPIMKKKREAPKHTQPHNHTIYTWGVAFYESASFDSSLKMDLDAGEARIEIIESNNLIAKKDNGGGTKAWYELNIIRIKNAKFLPPKRTSWPGPKPGKCDKCGGNKEKKIDCPLCRGTGRRTLTGRNFVIYLIRECRIAIEKIKGTYKAEKWENLANIERLPGSRKWLEWDSKELSADNKEPALLGAEGDLRNRVAALISWYDRAIALPYGTKPNTRVIPTYNSETKKMEGTEIEFPQLIRPKVTRNVDGTLSYSFDKADRLMIPYNYPDQSDRRRVASIPIIGTKGPLGSIENAKEADYWDNLLRKLRTDDFNIFFGRPEGKEGQLYHTKYYVEQQEQGEGDVRAASQPDPVLASDVEDDPDADPDEDEQEAAIEAAIKALDIESDSGQEIMRKLTNHYLRAADSITPEEASSLGLSDENIRQAADAAEEFQTQEEFESDAIRDEGYDDDEDYDDGEGGNVDLDFLNPTYLGHSSEQDPYEQDDDDDDDLDLEDLLGD